MTETAERRLPNSVELSDGPDLLLRRHRPEDRQGVYEQCQDEQMQRWTTIPVPYQPSHADEFIQHVASAWQAGTAASFAIEFERRFAGTIDLRLEEGDWAEVGYGLAAWARGRRVMSRSVRLVLGWAFGELALAGVHWRARVGNDASRQVAEACGFRVEGTVRGLLLARGERFDGWIGSILADEHAPARAAGETTTRVPCRPA